MITTCEAFSSSRRAFPAPLFSSTPLKLSTANPDQKVKKQVKHESLMLSNEKKSRVAASEVELMQLKVIQALVFKAVFHFKRQEQ